RRGGGPWTARAALDGTHDTSTPHAAELARAAVAGARAAVADDLSWRRPRAAARELEHELDAVERALDDAGVPGVASGTARRTTLRAQARAALAGGWRLATGRVAVAGVVAGAAASAVGLGHAAWATMGATAVLQGSTARAAVVRALQRGAGTVAGAALAWPLLAAPLGFWGTAAVVVALQTVTEVVVARHYGLAMLTITPMALLMTSLAHPAAPTALALDRAAGTVIGAVVGVLAVVLVHAHRRPVPSPVVGGLR
ncbi:FUSC family protein, partial [Cellulosimicrobium sp. CUA-896]|uniref:FUSC family protein n=1 Tax=Cellulosimicrobium sp. CUA-896 TaxID=1517881 RepID=UPI0011153ED1